VTRGLADLAVSVGRVPAELQAAQRAGVLKASLEVKAAIRREIVSAIGADRHMSNLRSKAKLDAGFDIKGKTDPTSLIKARGFYFAWVERGTRPHRITPRGNRRTRRGNRRTGPRALTIGGGLYGAANHPGQDGKHPFEKGWKKAAPATPGIFQAEVRAAYRRAWGI
jgi:hypothetical protein